MSSKSEETRIRILQAAWKLLEANRGDGVRMSDIAKQAEVSRQAVYLHFSNRSDLLTATTLYIDKIKDIDARLAPSRNAENGILRLELFIDAWGRYISEIYPVAKALLAMQDTDEDATAAWSGRMQALRHGCEAAIKALQKDGHLSSLFSHKEAVDMLWTILSIRNWEHLTQDCEWSLKKYLSKTKLLAHQLFVKQK